MLQRLWELACIQHNPTLGFFCQKMSKRTSNFLQCCLVATLLSCVKSQDFRMSAPNTDGWLNPDDVFSVSQSQVYTSGESPHMESDNNSGEKKNEGCEERLKGLIEKYSNCDKSVPTSSPDSEMGKEELSGTAVLPPAPPSVLECSNEGTGEKAYMKRFVQKLLEVSALKTGEVQNTNEIDLKLYISGDQLKTLRQFAKEEESKSIPLRKLDEIFTAVFVKPYINLPSLGSISNMFSNFKIGSFYISIVFPALWFFCILIWTRSVMKTFIWLVPVTFITSFLTTASKMFQDAELEWYKRGEHHIDANLDITAMRVLTKMFGEFVSDGMAHFGRGLLAFFAEFKDLGWFESTWKLPLACVVLIAFSVLLFLVLTGGSIRFPLFMGGFYFHNAGGTRASSEKVTSEVKTKAEAVLPASNIVFNFNNQLPSNVQDILQSISQCVPLQGMPQNSPIIPPTSVQNSGRVLAIAANCNEVVQDSMAGGDASLVGSSSQNQDNEAVFTFKAHRNNHSSSQKKQFHHLQARYKSGHKQLGGKLTRERHKSL